jgi:transposase
VLTVLRAGRTRDSGAGAVQQRLAPQGARIQGWLAEPHLTLKQLWRLLQEQGLGVSYPSLKRLVRRHLPPAAPRVTVRLEGSPGRQAPVDFGQVRVRVARETGTETWHRLGVFVMTLAYRRYRFVRFVERQALASWLDCHVRAFEFFHGVPQTVWLDNLKSGVVRPDRSDPKLKCGYQELEHPYGVVVDPAPVATPQYKVERAIPVVGQQWVAGQVYCDLAELNTQALRWCREGGVGWPMARPRRRPECALSATSRRV